MPTRRERAKIEEQRSAQIRKRRQLWMGAGVVVLLVVLAAGILASGILNPALPQPAAEAALSVAPATCSEVQSFPTQSRDHIAPNQAHPPYSSNPPTSGWHWADPQDWGIYTTPQVQEQLVHNLEHGGIVIQYKDLSEAEVQRLTDLVKRDNYHLILAPYPGLPADVKVALTAWNHLRTCTGVNEDAVRAFVNAYRNKGPELVP